MKLGVLGTGMVGQTIATKLVALGHDVVMGARTADNENATRWAAGAGGRARAGTFADAAAHGDIVFNCTNGVHTLAALEQAGADRLAGKILVDVANILGPDAGGGASLGERVQQALPRTRVVKTLNTVNCDVMVDPGSVAGGAHAIFLSGEDAAAKTEVQQLLASFGWREVIDLGGIATARASESYLGLWLALYRRLGTAAFNIHVAR